MFYRAFSYDHDISALLPKYIFAATLFCDESLRSVLYWICEGCGCNFIANFATYQPITKRVADADLSGGLSHFITSIT
jgi:hypothetical protein